MQNQKFHLDSALIKEMLCGFPIETFYMDKIHKFN